MKSEAPKDHISSHRYDSVNHDKNQPNTEDQ